jgi:hypothetical protein
MADSLCAIPNGTMTQLRTGAHAHRARTARVLKERRNEKYSAQNRFPMTSEPRKRPHAAHPTVARLIRSNPGDT